MLIKTPNGYANDFGNCRLIYSEDGRYVGQYQDDMFDEGVLFLRPEYGPDGLPRVNRKVVAPLTAEEMAGAA